MYVYLCVGDVCECICQHMYEHVRIICVGMRVCRRVNGHVCRDVCGRVSGRVNGHVC